MKRFYFWSNERMVTSIDAVRIRLFPNYAALFDDDGEIRAVVYKEAFDRYESRTLDERRRVKGRAVPGKTYEEPPANSGTWGQEPAEVGNKEG
jgi:hypothetical protein